VKKITISLMFLVLLSCSAFAAHSTRFGVGGQFGFLMDSMNLDKLSDWPGNNSDDGSNVGSVGGYLFVEQMLPGASNSYRQTFLGIKAGYDAHFNQNIDVSQGSVSLYSESWSNSAPIIVYYKVKSKGFALYGGGGVTYYEVGWKNTSYTDYRDPTQNEIYPDISRSAIIPTLMIGGELNLGYNFAIDIEGVFNLNSARLDNNAFALYKPSGEFIDNIHRDISWFNFNIGLKYYIF